MKVLLLIFIIAISVISCKSKDSTVCQYKLAELLQSDSPKVVVTYQNDTLYEVKDKVKDNSFSSGVYTFDKKRNLRFYAFFVNENQYRFSEEYDSMGNLIKCEGTPLVEYRLWKRNNDTVLFNAFLFSLNKTYENIEIITNSQDTIRPNLLYKSDIYTNMKCFSFTLPIAKNINELILYSKGVVTNVCTQQKEFFSDTVSFRGVILEKK